MLDDSLDESLGDNRTPRPAVAADAREPIAVMLFDG
jgi:hypothetical protein